MHDVQGARRHMYWFSKLLPYHYLRTLCSFALSLLNLVLPTLFSREWTFCASNHFRNHSALEPTSYPHTRGLRCTALLGACYMSLLFVMASLMQRYFNIYIRCLLVRLRLA
ncbi:hypothetical protein C8Q74DRAFT_142938 [Fomes fomentarius]|nr:hypothetical protein C8Q74DRAFT_142938 [Fomes fomentarius]